MGLRGLGVGGTIGEAPNAASAWCWLSAGEPECLILFNTGTRPGSDQARLWPGAGVGGSQGAGRGDLSKPTGEVRVGRPPSGAAQEFGKMRQGTRAGRKPTGCVREQEAGCSVVSGAETRGLWKLGSTGGKQAQVRGEGRP